MTLAAPADSPFATARRAAGAAAAPAGAPYAESVALFGERPLERLVVPGHAADADAVPELAAFFGERMLRMDVARLIPGIDLGPDSPFELAQRLAAEAWGAARTWFLTNGSSQANRIAALALGFSGHAAQPVVAQRSTHSSWVDGLILAGLDARWVQPSLDRELGAAHGVSVAALQAALSTNPDAKAAYIVSPSYFGATADIAGLARVAHSAGVPLVVDAAWGAHYGFHPLLPESPLHQGADLVIMSTHKLGGSLTQSAMLHLGHGPFAAALEPLVERAFVLEQSTSESALLLASLDLARLHLQSSEARIGRSLELAEEFREQVRSRGRFRIASDFFGRFDDIEAVDPSRVSIDVAAGGLSGHAVRDAMLREFDIHFELSTDACVLAIIGPGSTPDVTRIVEALHSLPDDDCAVDVAGLARFELPLPGESRMRPREAAFAASDVVSASAAVGRVSSTSLAAYPPGIPNVMPGEVITAETVEFLRHVAAAPAGYVRGAADPGVSTFAVVAE